MNSLYGAVRNIYFLYYVMEMAEAITMSGQLSVKWVSIVLNNYLNKVLGTKDIDYVIYIDTDSVYINFEPMIIKVFGSTDIDKLKGEEFLDKVCAEKIEKIIDGAYKELFETLGAYENAMKMKREKINDYALFLKKKKYVLSTLNSEGVHYEEPKISVTGLESVRSSTPEIVRKKMKESYEVFLKKEENELQEYIEKFKQEFIKLPADKIAKNSGTDSIEKFMENGTYTKGCPAHVRGCIVYNNYIKHLGFEKKFDQIKSGDKVKSVYLKLPNPVHENIISFPGVLPKELGLDQYIDYDMQFEKVYLKPMRDIANVLDWQVEKVDNIMDIFDFS
jgi:DNA polymerase elongation subunit (family B)